jgi:Rrf2 family protein
VKLSKKTDYALRSLCYLAAEDRKEYISIRALSEANDIPYRFLQQIVLDLKQHGWIITQPGRDGGLRLARPADAITVGEVVRVFDGVLAPIGCVSITNYEACSQETTCLFRPLLLEVRNYTADLLDRTTLRDLIDNKTKVE